MSKTTKQVIEFVEESHTYLLNGVVIPSVSEIISDDTYASIPPHILENAAKRGSAVHLASEMIDKGKKPKLDSSFAEWVVQYLRFKLSWINKNYNQQIAYDSIETIVHTNEYGGTIDRVILDGDDYVICDIKTTSKLYKDKIALQLGGYAYAHSLMNNVSLDEYRGSVIWLRKNSWKYVEITPNVDGFLEKLEQWKARQVDNEIDW
ncbi:exonuclease [PinkBerry-associated phage LS06-2018-MD08]|nr:exonuclease [PinkBerry-associated phage LS06-2018-MD08]